MIDEEVDDIFNHSPFTDCPHCGGGPFYQDRFDAVTNILHCDDCGEEVTAKMFDRIKGNDGTLIQWGPL